MAATISTFKEIITDARLLGLFVVNSTAEVMKRNTAAVREEEAHTRTLAASAEATLSKLDDGLHIVSAEIANIKTQELPDVKNSEMAAALTAGLDAIENLSIKTVARTARKQSLQEVLDYGRTVVRPTVNLANLKASAEWATAQAEVAACVALESAGDAYAAGAALRNAEGVGNLFPPHGKTANLFAEARSLYGIAGTCWIGYYDAQRQLQKEQK